MTDYIIKNGPDLPEGVDAGEFEQDDGRIVCEWRLPRKGESYFCKCLLKTAQFDFVSELHPIPIRKPAQPPAWTVPAVLQGEEWEGWMIKKNEASSVVQLFRNNVAYCTIVGVNDYFNPLAALCGLTPQYFDGLAPGQSVPLGPQPKPSWKCTGGLACTGLTLTHDGKWKIWKFSPSIRQDTMDTVVWSHTQTAIAEEDCGGWYNWLRLLGSLPDVEGIPVQERIWKL